MNVRALILAAAFLTATMSLFAQESEKNEKIKYSNVTEFGFSTASPKGFSFEATTAHGFSLEKQHHFGLGTGIGVWYNSVSNRGNTYMPIFFNYRFYFKPNKTFSPHINVAVGGLAIEDVAGIYSAITMGFRSGAFSFSSGFSFMPYCVITKHYLYYYNEWGIIYPAEPNSKTFTNWYYPFGITLKLGFAF